MSFLLGIDIGTSACKVSVFHKNGTMISTESKAYPVYYPEEGWAEQNPMEWWQAICETIPHVLEKGDISPSEIVGIGVDGQSWSAIPLDRDGDVLCNTPIWMDTRSKDICDRLNQEIGEDTILALCGNPLQPTYSTPKILWYKEHRPQIYKQIDKIVQSNSFIVYKLTGEITQDMSQGYGLHCFHMEKGVWDNYMAREMGFPPSFLPEIHHCHEVVGTVSEKAAKECGLISGIPVVAGGLDAATATLGCGVLHIGETQEQGGQAGGMSICTDSPKGDKRLILSYHVVPDLWLLQGGTVGGGGVMKWLEQEFGAYERLIGQDVGKRSLQIFDDMANDVPAGSEGLIFLPYMAGERCPIWDPTAKGVYYGLDYTKTKAHIIRSSMEGTAYALRHNLEAAAETGARVDVLRAVGGAANSLIWTQIKSDITGKPIVVPSADTATSLGAIILAGVGVGIYKDFEEAVRITVKEQRYHKPNAKHKELYDKYYEKYRDLYERVKGL